MSCGTRAQDFRPGDPDGVNSSVLPRWYRSSEGGLRTAGTAALRTAVDATCSVACESATPRRPAPSPVLRLLWLGTPPPNLPGARVRSRRLHRGAAHCCTAGYCELHLRVLPAVLLTAAPDHCGPPGAVVSPVAVHQQPWLRNSTTAPSCELQLRLLLPGSSSLSGPAVSLGYERNHNHATTQCLLWPS